MACETPATNAAHAKARREVSLRMDSLQFIDKHTSNALTAPCPLLHTLAFTTRGNDLIHVIMLRKATAKEVRTYEKGQG
jgi:hypothetical protein